MVDNGGAKGDEVAYRLLIEKRKKEKPDEVVIGEVDSPRHAGSYSTGQRPYPLDRMWGQQEVEKRALVLALTPKLARYFRSQQCPPGLHCMD